MKIHIISHLGFCMTILKRKFSKIFVVKFVIKTNVLNLLHFQVKIACLFFLQNEVLKRKCVKQTPYNKKSSNGFKILFIVL